MSFIKREEPEQHMDPRSYSPSSNKNDGSHGDYTQSTGQSSQTSITAFLAKLWALVNDSTCDDLITWDPTGASFHVYDQARFSREILPRYFKHNNFASFIRQLNMYGFRKMSTIEHGTLKNERDDIEFAHPHFVKGQESLLELIKRRAPENQQKSNPQGGSHPSSALVSTNYCESKSSRCVEFLRLLEDVQSLQSKQTSLSDKLSYLQTENEALWGEIGSLRHKHAKQQQVVSKLMEFLVHFITNTSVQSHEQQPSNEVVSAHSQPTNTSMHTNNAPLVLREHILSPNTLKRKQAALMLSEQSNKRTTTQQQHESQQRLYNLANIGRQQSVTINELTDNDMGGWAPTTSNISPLIDLVPSPPPSAHGVDDEYQPQANDSRWSTATNEPIKPSVPDLRTRTQHNKSISTVGIADNVPNAHIPDFFLCTDSPNETNRTVGQTLGTNVTGTGTSQEDTLKQLPISALLKAEKLDFPNKYSPSQTNPIYEHNTSPTLNSTLYNPNQQDSKNDPPLEQLSFSLDDITGDVDHIQSSLENIRELMFENLPDGTSIDDLFCADNGLLSPLLQSTSNENPAENLILENIQHQTPATEHNTSQQTEANVDLQCISDVNNQLLEQLITETAIVEEQRKIINKLTQENSDLTDKLESFEKNKPKRK